MNDDPKPDTPFALDIDFGEALARFAKTKPEEVEPPPGKKKKAARPEPRLRPDGPPINASGGG